MHLRAHFGRSAGAAKHLLLAGALLSTACVSVDRPGAQALGKAGYDAVHAAAGEYRTQADAVGTAQRLIAFQRTNTALGACSGASPVQWSGTSNDPQHTCDLIYHSHHAYDELNARVGRAQRELNLRASATEHLAAAYQAFIAEAEFDAGAAIEQPLRDAGAAVDAFVSAASGGTVPPVVGEMMTAIGVTAAQSAQRDRLVGASHALQLATRQFREALRSSRQLLREVRSAVANEQAETQRALARAIPAGSTLNEMLASAGLPVLSSEAADAFLAQNEGLRAALIAERIGRPVPDSDQTLDALDDLLNTLDRQHEKFRMGTPLSLAEVSTAIDRLTTIVNAYREGKGQ